MLSTWAVHLAALMVLVATDDAGNVNNVVVVRAKQAKSALPSRSQSQAQDEKGRGRVDSTYLRLPSHDEDVAVVSTDEESPPPYEEHTYTFDDPSSENMQTPRPLSTSRNPFFDDVNVNRLTTAFAEALRPDPALDEVRPEHAPLFAHECLSSCDGDSLPPSSPYQDAHDGPAEADEVAEGQAPLEMFPSDGPHIFEYIAETESRLEEDVTSDDDSRVSSPVLMPGTPVDTVFSRRLSPPNDHSPLLENIPEENVPEFDGETPEHMTLEGHSAMAVASNEAVLVNSLQPKSVLNALDASSAMPASHGGVTSPKPDSECQTASSLPAPEPPLTKSMVGLPPSGLPEEAASLTMVRMRALADTVHTGFQYRGTWG